MQKTTRPAMPCAGATLIEDMEVRVFLLERGVEVGQKGHDVPEGRDSLEEKDTSDDIVRGSTKPLAGWVKSSGRVLTF